MHTLLGSFLRFVLWWISCAVSTHIISHTGCDNCGQKPFSKTLGSGIIVKDIPNCLHRRYAILPSEIFKIKILRPHFKFTKSESLRVGAKHWLFENSSPCHCDDRPYVGTAVFPREEPSSPVRRRKPLLSYVQSLFARVARGHLPWSPRQDCSFEYKVIPKVIFHPHIHTRMFMHTHTGLYTFLYSHETEISLERDIQSGYNGCLQGVQVGHQNMGWKGDFFPLWIVYHLHTSIETPIEL